MTYFTQANGLNDNTTQWLLHTNSSLHLKTHYLRKAISVALPQFLLARQALCCLLDPSMLPPTHSTLFNLDLFWTNKPMWDQPIYPVLAYCSIPYNFIIIIIIIIPFHFLMTPWAQHRIGTFPGIWDDCQKTNPSWSLLLSFATSLLY